MLTGDDTAALTLSPSTEHTLSTMLGDRTGSTFRICRRAISRLPALIVRYSRNSPLVHSVACAALGKAVPLRRRRSCSLGSRPTRYPPSYGS